MTLQNTDLFMVQPYNQLEVYRTRMEDIERYVSERIAAGDTLNFRGKVNLTQPYNNGDQLDPNPPLNADVYINTTSGPIGSGWVIDDGVTECSVGDRIVHVGLTNSWILISGDSTSGTVTSVTADNGVKLGDLSTSKDVVIEGIDAAIQTKGVVTISDPAAVDVDGKYNPVASNVLTEQHFNALKSAIDSIDTGGGGGASVIVSEIAPLDPSNGDLWYADSTVNEGGGRLYIRISGQWVDVSLLSQQDEPSIGFSGNYNDLTNQPSIGSGVITLKDNQNNVLGSFNLNQNASQEITIPPYGSGFSGNYNDLTNKPTIGNATVTLKQGGDFKGSFTVNATDSVEINLDSGGGGSGEVNLGWNSRTNDGDVTNSAGLDATIPAASSGNAGLMTASEFVKLSGIESGATNTVYQDLTWNSFSDKGSISITNGSSADVPVATSSTAGLMSPSQKTKLDGISAGATGNQTLSWQSQSSQGLLTISGGNQLSIPLANTSTAGLMSPSDKSALSNIPNTSSFLRKDTADTASGRITFNGGITSNADSYFENNYTRIGTSSNYGQFERSPQSSISKMLLMNRSDDSGASSATAIRTQTGGTKVYFDLKYSGAFFRSLDRNVDTFDAIPYACQTLKSLTPNLQGFSGQDFIDHLPSAVEQETITDNQVMVNEMKLLPILTKAIQELSAENDALKLRVDALEASIQADSAGDSALLALISEISTRLSVLEGGS